MLLLLEVAFGLLCIVDGGHEIVPVVPPGQQSAVSRQKAITGGGAAGIIPSFFCLHHQHAKHFAPVGIRLDIRVRRNELLHLLRRQLAQRVRLVAEGIGKPLRPVQFCI